MNQPHRHAHDDEARRAPLRLPPLPRPRKAEPPAPAPADPAWILEWNQPAPGDGTDA